MPAIAFGKVLVTGANGYIAAWAVRTLLQQGFAVKGVVRSDSAAARVRELFADVGDRFQTHIAPDYIKVRASYLCRIGYSLYTRRTLLMTPRGTSTPFFISLLRVISTPAIRRMSSNQLLRVLSIS